MENQRKGSLAIHDSDPDLVDGDWLNATSTQRAMCGYGSWVTIVVCRESFPRIIYNAELLQ